MEGGFNLRCATCSMGPGYFQEEVGRGEVVRGAWLCPSCRARPRPRGADALPLPAAATIQQARERLEAAARDRYEVGPLLGRGMGLVFEARLRGGLDRFAIKTLAPGLGADEAAIKRFLREASLLRQLGDHEHLARFFEAGYGEGLFYLVTELVPGEDLAALLEREGRLSLEVVGPLVVQALDGLARAHAATVSVELSGEPEGAPRSLAGLVHRDLKPANLLVERRLDVLRAKVADLGLAKACDAAGQTTVTGEGETGGTPLYWPAEQLDEFRYLRPTADVFSMGALLYECLAGAGLVPRPALRGLSARALRSPKALKLVRHDRVEPLSVHCPTLPRAVIEVVQKALAEDPAARYPDAGPFRDALRAALGAQGIALAPCGCPA